MQDGGMMMNSNVKSVISKCEKNNNGEEVYFNTDDGASNCIIFKTEPITKGKNDDEI